MRGSGAMTPRPRSSLIAAWLLAACILVVAPGCTPFWEETGETAPGPPAAAQPDPAERRLAEAAERAEAALTVLARIRAADTPPPPAGPPADVPGRSPLPPALRRPVTLNWIGPLETLAETLAAYAGYRFVAAGAPPVRPAMVAIAAEDAPVIEVLRDAGLQAGSAATLTVDAGGRTVRLDWSGDHPDTGEHPGAAREARNK